MAEAALWKRDRERAKQLRDRMQDESQRLGNKLGLVWVAAGLSLLTGLVVAVRMYETHPPGARTTRMGRRIGPGRWARADRLFALPDVDELPDADVVTLERAIVAGHSMGSWTARRVAADPEDAHAVEGNVRVSGPEPQASADRLLRNRRHGRVRGRPEPGKILGAFLGYSARGLREE